MAIKEGYNVQGKKTEDMLALAKRRSENIRASAQAHEMAAAAQQTEMRENPMMTLTKPAQGYGPSTGGAQGPLRVPKTVVDSIKEKGKVVLEEMGVDPKDLK